MKLSHFWPRVALALTAGMLWGAGCGDAIAPSEAAPRANAGPDFIVPPDSTVVLDGRDSEQGTSAIDGYQWTLNVRPDGSSAELTDATEPVASLTPDAFGAYLITLVVTAGGVASAPDTTVVTADVVNFPPAVVPDCGPGTDCRVLHGQSAPLDGRASSDAEGDPFTVQWSQVLNAEDCALCRNLETCAPSNAEASLSDADQLLASFTAPDAAGLSLVFALTANDGARIVSDCVVYDTFNTAPVVLIASPSLTTNPGTINEGEMFNLSASPSFDPDEPDDLAFSWTQVSGMPTAITDPVTGAVVSVTAPTLDAPPGTTPSVDLTFEVVASDGIDQTSAQVTVVVQNL
ncbi:MAG: hypothetical protein AAF658_00585 [Myxococcota bacterium]